MRRLRNVFVMILALNLVFGSLLSSAFAATSSSDVDKHWASETLKKWVDAGLLTGYPDGTYRPNAPVKRSEFVALLNRALKLSDTAAGVSFSDLSEKHWAYQEIAIAVKAGYLQGADGKVSPDRYTARQEAAVMIASAIKLDTKSGGDVSKFGDAGQIADWSEGAIAALAARQVLKGDTKGNVNPRANITRAEAVVAIDAALGLGTQAAKVLDKAGTYGPADTTETIDGDVVIAADGVILQNTIVNGDLIIAKEVQDGDVTLKRVTVKGTTKVNGGGENSVHIEDSVLLRIIVDKASGKVRIVAIGATTVQDVIVNSAVKIEESNVTDSGFKNIELSNALPEGATADLVGHFEDVRVMAANIQVNIPSGSVDNLHVGEGATDNTINISKEAKVLQLVLDVVSKLIGEGTIDKATINENAKGSSFESKPTDVDGAAKDTISITPPSNTTGSTGSGSNNGGGNGGGDNGGGSGSGNGNGGGSTPSCSIDCTNASLSGLSVTSSEYDLSLVQRDLYNAIAGTGFNASSFSYSVEVPRDFAESDIEISVTAATYATLWYGYSNDDYEGKYEQISNDDRTFNVKLKPLQDARISIYVTSGDGKYSKSYSINFFYPREVQEAFRIEKYTSFGNDSYSLVSRSLEHGDEVLVTVPAEDARNSEEFSVTGTVYGSNLHVHLSNFVPAEATGALQVTVTRGDEQILSGSYEYDFTALDLLSDANGFSFSVLTKQQLREFDAGSNSISRHTHGYAFEFVPAQITNPLMSNAKFYHTSWSTIYQEDEQPQVPTLEDVKTSYDKWNNSFSTLSEYARSRVAFGSNDTNEVRYQYVRVVFLDANQEPIGYYVYKVELDEDHVGEGVTIIPPTTSL